MHFSRTQPSPPTHSSTLKLGHILVKKAKWEQASSHTASNFALALADRLEQLAGKPSSVFQNAAAGNTGEYLVKTGLPKKEEKQLCLEMDSKMSRAQYGNEIDNRFIMQPSVTYVTNAKKYRKSFKPHSIWNNSPLETIRQIMPEAHNILLDLTV
jgi:hypothetical protein